MEINSFNGPSFSYRYFEGYTPVLSVSDPDLLKEVLVKDFENFQARKVQLYNILQLYSLIVIHSHTII